jgi:hypothetical protein
VHLFIIYLVICFKIYYVSHVYIVLRIIVCFVVKQNGRILCDLKTIHAEMFC